MSCELCDAGEAATTGAPVQYHRYGTPGQTLCKNSAIVPRQKVNLGSSDRHFPGFANVDICEPADLIADLNEEWPWPDSSLEEIRAWDLIEHLRSPIHTMNEAWRVLKPNGIFDIIVPTTDGRGAWQDPGHVSFWNRNSFFYYEHGNPHLTRFAPANGVRCAYKIESEKQEMLVDQVSKLHIILKAVKL